MKDREVEVGDGGREGLVSVCSCVVVMIATVWYVQELG